MPADPIRLDEVLAELSRLEHAHHDGPQGFTCVELATALGFGQSAAQQRLSVLVRSGTVAFVGHRPETNIAGRRCRIPVYQLTHNPGGTM